MTQVVSTDMISNSREIPVAQEHAGRRPYTPDEVAYIFTVDRRTALKWGREGKLERVKITGKVVRFTPESVNSLLRSKDQGVESVTAPKTKPKVRGKRSITKKGGDYRTSRTSSWRSLREEVTRCR